MTLISEYKLFEKRDFSLTKDEVDIFFKNLSSLNIDIANVLEFSGGVTSLAFQKALKTSHHTIVESHKKTNDLLKTLFHEKINIVQKRQDIDKIKYDIILLDKLDISGPALREHLIVQYCYQEELLHPRTIFFVRNPSRRFRGYMNSIGWEVSQEKDDSSPFFIFVPSSLLHSIDSRQKYFVEEILIKRYFKNHKGTLIECYPRDSGIGTFLESNHWKCHNIEPNNVLFKMLQRQRPHSLNHELTLSENTEMLYLKDNISYPKKSYVSKSPLFTTGCVEVSGESYLDFIKSQGLGTVDLLILHMMGGYEFNVLRGMYGRSIQGINLPKVILVQNPLFGDQIADLRRFMFHLGYNHDGRYDPMMIEIFVQELYR